MMLYQILIFLRYRVFLTLVHYYYNIFAYVLGLVENEGWCLKPKLIAANLVIPWTQEFWKIGWECSPQVYREQSFHHSWDIMARDGKLDPPFF